MKIDPIIPPTIDREYNIAIIFSVILARYPSYRIQNEVWELHNNNKNLLSIYVFLAEYHVTQIETPSTYVANAHTIMTEI